ncbi:MAG: hypothetical protein ABFC77_12515 [Thermoguttaceae bacterium]
MPAVEPAIASPAGQLVSHPNSSSEILQSPGGSDIAASPSTTTAIPSDVRDGVFQKVLFDATWLAAGKSNGLGINDLELQTIFAVPCPKRESPLVMTPGFGVQYLQSPKNVDLPPRLYTSYLDFRWLSQVTPTVGLDLAITPGVYSDFEQSSDKAFRWTGHAAAAWTWTDNVKVVLGAAYLDRPDCGVLPIGGVIWTPSEDVKFDLVFPHPRISRRIGGGSAADVSQDWVYVAGEFAGDAWAIRRSDGTDDQVVLSDYRLIVGVERKVRGGLSARVEAGYVFGRRIRYSSDTPEDWPADTVLLRGGLTY